MARVGTRKRRAGMLTMAVLGAATLWTGLVPSARAQTATSAARPSAGYIIGPADVLQIIVWKEPDLTREVTVRFDGVVTVPLLGDQKAAGHPPAVLAENLEKAYARYVEAPRVNVVVSQSTSARFFVLGEVARAGSFPLAGPTTVLQALALAGGLKEYAKKDSIVIIRENREVVAVNYDRISEGKDISQNVSLLPGDTIVVR